MALTGRTWKACYLQARNHSIVNNRIAPGSEKEDSSLLLMRQKGKPWKEMSEDLGRTLSACEWRFGVLEKKQDDENGKQCAIAISLAEEANFSVFKAQALRRCKVLKNRQ